MGRLWIAVKALRPGSPARTLLSAPGRVFVVALPSLGLTAFISIAVWYATDRRYYDFAEPTMPAVAWMFEVGKPLYPPPDAPDRYAHIYGPMAFIPHALAMRVLGGDLRVTKSVGASAGLLGLLCLFLALRCSIGTRGAVVWAGYCALLLLVFRNAAFWTRPDSLELFCVSIGLWAIVRRSAFAGWLILGVSAGVLWNLKFSGPLYSLPLFVLYVERHDARRLMLAVATSAIVVVLPFVAFANISVHDYLTWIRLSGSNGIVWSTLRQNVEWILYVLVPLALSRRALPHQHVPPVSTRVTGSLYLALGGVALLASKPGAGPYHLLPFLPITFYLAGIQSDRLTADGDRRLRLPILAFTAVAVLIALAQQTSFISTVREINAIDAIADVMQFSSEHPDAAIEIGYSSDERMTFVRPLLVFRSGVYLLDQPAIQEHQLAGVGIPATTLAALRSCAVTFWLIPKGGVPFSAINRYPTMHGRPLFDDSFRRAFFESYRPAGTTNYFDVWTCAGRRKGKGRREKGKGERVVIEGGPLRWRDAAAQRSSRESSRLAARPSASS